MLLLRVVPSLSAAVLNEVINLSNLELIAILLPSLSLLKRRFCNAMRHLGIVVSSCVYHRYYCNCLLSFALSRRKLHFMLCGSTDCTLISRQLSRSIYGLYHSYGLLLFVCPENLRYIDCNDKFDPYTTLMYTND